MKRWASLIVIALILLGIASFLCPSKSYYPWFIFTSDHQVIERVVDDFNKWSLGVKSCFIVVFAPAMAFAILQSRLKKNLSGLLFASIILTTMLFGAGFGLGFSIFEVQVKMLFGYFLFISLGVIGCLIFWIMTFGEIWHRVYNHRQKFKAA